MGFIAPGDPGPGPGGEGTGGSEFPGLRKVSWWPQLPGPGEREVWGPGLLLMREGLHSWAGGRRRPGPDLGSLKKQGLEL